MWARAVVLIVVVACGGRARDVEHAKAARYDAEFSVLIAETADVVRRWYRHVEVEPSGIIRTSWQQVARPRPLDPYYETQSKADREASRMRYFLRFHITISNTRPSRIAVVGRAAFLREGETKPIELRPEGSPRWTNEIADKLRLKIHARLERFAR